MTFSPETLTVSNNKGKSLKWDGSLTFFGIFYMVMGGICSRKRDQHVVEDDLHRGTSGRYCRSGSIKWSRSRSLRSKSNQYQCPGGGTCPSLMDLCINRIREDFHKYESFSILPRDISQQIFNELVDSHCLTEASLEAFRDCALQDIDLGEYSGVDDNWMDVISSQGLSLLSVDVSGSQVTDNGLRLLKDCSNLQALTLNYCDQFSEYGLKHISGLSNLDSLSIRKSSSVKPDGMRAFSNLFNLEKLDLERCSEIHGGFVHLKVKVMMDFHHYWLMGVVAVALPVLIGDDKGNRGPSTGIDPWTFESRIFDPTSQPNLH
ncbi:hypothetical protein V8G54_014205 [Vigna mungo]|uniref:Uncharacterized protein n=1 Tax=Vigna mungo TaxID=3915 RepID=A0AAQ3NG70_VIGMU